MQLIKFPDAGTLLLQWGFLPGAGIDPPPRQFPPVALVLLVVALLSGLACSGKHEPSQAERQQARDTEVQSFAIANSAALVPDIKGSAVTLDWQKALRGPNKTFAFRGSVDDIFEKDGKYFLNVSDIDNKFLCPYLFLGATQEARLKTNSFRQDPNLLPPSVEQFRIHPQPRRPLWLGRLLNHCR
jgi:hypothetical protein